MIKSEKIAFATKALCWYQARMMKRTFSYVRIRYHAEMPGYHELPTIYYANHSSKWDQHVGGYITEALWGQDSYYMIALQMMRPYPILKYTGGFSIHQTDPFEAAQNMEYCRELITAKPNRAVWVFPQGGIRPNQRRPLNFQQGTAQLIRLLGNVRVVPVALHYDFLNNSKPELSVNFGTPMIFERPVKTPTRKLTEQLEVALTTDLDKLGQDLIDDNYEDFDMILYGKGILLNRIYTRYRSLNYRLGTKLGLIHDDEAEKFLKEVAEMTGQKDKVDKASVITKD